MYFLGEKLKSFGQFWSSDSIDPMLSAWAIVNSFCSLLLGAKKGGKSLAEFFGADLHDIPWVEALSLCSINALSILLLLHSLDTNSKYICQLYGDTTKKIHKSAVTFIDGDGKILICVNYSSQVMV
jgi:hypothetical protein